MTAETLMRNGDGDDRDSWAWSQLSEWTMPVLAEVPRADATNPILRQQLGASMLRSAYTEGLI